MTSTLAASGATAAIPASFRNVDLERVPVVDDVEWRDRLIRKLDVGDIGAGRLGDIDRGLLRASGAGRVVRIELAPVFRALLAFVRPVRGFVFPRRGRLSFLFGKSAISQSTIMMSFDRDHFVKCQRT